MYKTESAIWSRFPHYYFLQWVIVGKSKKELDSKESEIELHPDAWARFERAVDIVAKSPPQHRSKSDKPQARKSAPRPVVSSAKS